MTYRLVRTLPDGTEREHTGLQGLGKVERAVFFCLTDNRVATPPAATAAARAVSAAPLGTDVPTPCGYTFRVELEG